MTLRTMLAAALLATGAMALAGTPTPPSLKVEGAWIRWLPANLPAAGYATIVNGSGTPMRLVAASSPDYHKVTLHQSRLEDDDSTMVAVSHIDVPAHGRARLSPGGYHLMLMHATHPIKPGDKVTMDLKFAGGQSLQVDFSVLPANSTGPGGSD